MLFTDYNKPVITVFNKVDLYKAHAFDAWLDQEVKDQLMKDLGARWQRDTHYNAIFISALENTISKILEK